MKSPPSNTLEFFTLECSPMGGIPDFKCSGWLNGGKNLNPKKLLGLPTKPKKISGPKLTHKISHAKFPSLEKSHTMPLRIRGCHHKSSDCFEYPQRSLLKSSHSQKILYKFPYPKKSKNRRSQTQRSPSIIPVTWNPEYPPPPPPGSVAKDGWGQSWDVCDTH